jgi:glycosyltransferase involved in cell wall biosynthesis
MAPQKKKQLPFVSVCTPTFNRRPFIETMFNCFRNQTYPKHRIEWIIVDDGTDKIKDLVEASNIPQIRYFEVADKMTLGAKRNYMHKFVRGSIIVYMDDDDYYPPERIEDAVEKLEGNPQAMAAGSSEIYIYFKHIRKMYKCGPYNPNHATAGTFAFRTELLKTTKYEETASVAEERAFLKEYTVPFVQLDPMKAILVFSHNHNSFDKRKMLDNPHPDFFRECDKTVEMFIRKPDENGIYNFFMKDIDGLLENYEPGDPKMKPDVLKQIKEIEEKREQMVKEEMAKQQANGQIMLQQPGKPPLALNNQQIVEMIQQQQSQLQQLLERCQESDKIINYLQQQLLSSNGTTNVTQSNVDLESMVVTLQKQLVEKTRTIRELTKNSENSEKNNFSNSISSEMSTINEMQNVVTMLQKQLVDKTKTIRELSKSNVSDDVVANLQNQLSESKVVITTLSAKIDEMSKIMDNSKTEYSEKNKVIVDLSTEVENLRMENMRFHSKNADNEMKLENRVRQLEGIISNLQTQLTDKNMEVIAASQKQGDFSQKYSEISQKYSELTQKYLDLIQKYSDANVQIAALSQQILDLTPKPAEEPPSETVTDSSLNRLSDPSANIVETFTRIPIELVDSSKADKSKSDPEFCVDAED